jgi:HlyD family secretion protein
MIVAIETGMQPSGSPALGAAVKSKQPASASDEAPQHALPASKPGRPSRGWLLPVVLSVLCAAAIGGGIFLRISRGQSPRPDKGQDPRRAEAAATQDQSHNKAALPVNVAKPQKGGMARATTQPGTLHFFEYADLYAKASGFLRAQVVDIGDTVEKGQVLAEIYDPERKQEIELNAAEVERAKAAVEQSKSLEMAAESEVKVAEAAIEVKKTEISQTAAIRRFREKEFIRYLELARHQAVDQRVADEKQEEFEGAKAAEEKAHAAVMAAEAEVVKARIQVLTAKANVQHAQAQERYAEAQLGQAKILNDYTRIISPYTGVVTQRNFHDGDFIRDSIRGGELPVLSVARTNLMRVIVYVPDRDTPYLNRGDEAVIRLDALPGEEFKGKVARFSNVEDPTNRTMRTEIDLPNPTGRFHMGMYGAVSILLEPPTDHLTIPSKALREVEAGGAFVYVAQGGQAHKRNVRIGRDNGLKVEVIAGLTADDDVIVGYTGSLQDGEPIVAAPAEAPSAEKKDEST